MDEKKVGEKKACIKCGKLLPKTEEYFRKNSAMLDGFEGQCKKCRQKYFADYRAGKRIGRGKKNPVVEPNPKRQASKKTDPAPAAPVMTASPTEIVVALRKGMAAEIVAMITEKYQL